MSDLVTVTFSIDDAIDLRDILMDRPHTEEWSNRAVAELTSAIDGWHAAVPEPQSLRA